MLVITNYVPVAELSAGERRLIRMCELLSDVCRIDLVAYSSDHRSDAVRRRPVPGIRILPSSGDLEVRLALRSHRYDIILFEFWRTAERYLSAARSAQPSARIMIDSVDLEFLRMERAAALGVSLDTDTLREMRERELECYRRADSLIMCSDAEAEVYREVCDRPSDLSVVGIIVDGGTVHRRVMEPLVVFVGNYLHAPNLDGVAWFCREVWPRVLERVPAATLEIVGANVTAPMQELNDLVGVHVRGFVEDLPDVYASAAVVVAPLRFGAGVKGKVCEALAAGVPLVSTTVGIEGLQLRRGRDLLVADGADDFADAVVTLLEDPVFAESMAESGRRETLGLCGSDGVRRALLALLEKSAPAPTTDSRSKAPDWIRSISLSGAIRVVQALRTVRGRARSHAHGHR